MNRVDRKNIWRRLEANKVREQRVISGFVKAKYPEVYKDAVNFYNALNKIYPSKRDLRKTNEYEWMKNGTPDTFTKKYYQRRKPYQRKSKKATVKRDGPSDNMRLIIPLMENPVTPSTEQVVETTVESSVNNTTPEETNHVMIEDAEIVIESSADDKTQDNVFEPSLGEIIPDSVLEEIMEGLRQDPDLQALFDDDINIEIDETSPLERELMYW